MLGGKRVLPESLRPNEFGTLKKEDWEYYRKRLHLSYDEAELQFYRQVVYDHFSHFNNHYPDFNLENYRFSMIELSAKDANDSIRYFRDEIVDWWATQYRDFASKNQDYIIFRAMSKSKTFPFPPVLLETRLIESDGFREYGRPLHLIEGTHRISYLREMLAQGLVLAESLHKFVLVSPVENNT